MAASVQKFLFEKNEAVLAYHGPLIHPATVEEQVSRKAPDGKTDVKLYLLHYLEWSSHWDEWVPESRLLKETAENKSLQTSRLKEFQRLHTKRKRAEGAAAASSKAKAPKPAAAGAAGGAVVDEALCAEIREQLRLPHGAKLKLIEDWESITRERKLSPLPREQSISALLDEFIATKARRTSHERIYGEVCEGVRAYFNQALPTLLLYKYERRQYRELKEQHKHQTPVEYYGCEHLLRLFVKLPELLARCQMQKEHMTVLVAKLSELLKFVVQQKTKFLAESYELPEEEYLHWWAQEATTN